MAQNNNSIPLWRWSYQEEFSDLDRMGVDLWERAWKIKMEAEACYFDRQVAAIEDHIPTGELHKLREGNVRRRTQQHLLRDFILRLYAASQ